MLPPFKLEQAVNQLVREEWGRMLGSLVGSTGDLQLAEDVLQDAVEAALLDWKAKGLPVSPAAWLITTARRKAIDHLRRQSRLARLKPDFAYLIALEADTDSDNPAQFRDEVIPDKRLELIFTCCHPALDNKTRVALTLRTLGGLSTDEIARAFLDKPSAMAQRLVRARHKINAAGIAYEVPGEEHLAERLEGVLSVVYFIFNEGYASSTGESLTRVSLCDESIRLGRILHTLLPTHSEVAGLLALMLLHDSRRRARETSVGGMISLERQNRQCWDQHKISEGIHLLKTTLALQQAGPYQLQAAISAVHAESEDWESTDWRQIVALYEVLYSLQPSPVVRLNQAVALSYAESPHQALMLLHTLNEYPAMQSYQPYHVAYADLLFRVDRHPEALKHMNIALAITSSVVEYAFLRQRLDEMNRLIAERRVNSK